MSQLAHSALRARPGRTSFGLTRGVQLAAGADPDSGPGEPRRDLFIGVGVARLSRRDIFQCGAAGVAVALERRLFRLPPFPSAMRGVAALQNLPSVAAAAALGAAPGMAVLDMCAAPGGKTCAIADAMRDTGSLLALDRGAAKVAEIRAMAESFGLTCVRAARADATRLLRLPQELKDAMPAPVRTWPAASAAAASPARGWR